MRLPGGRDESGSTGTDYDTAVKPMKGIKRDKRKIKIAINGLLPHTYPTNAAARGEFHLPAKLPFV